jgi:hypothetical protein
LNLEGEVTLYKFQEIPVYIEFETEEMAFDQFYSVQLGSFNSDIGSFPLTMISKLGKVGEFAIE